MIELLSPVGDFECLKAAVQNGANSVYFGANLFSARAFASNFDIENLRLETKINQCNGCSNGCEIVTVYKNDKLLDFWGNHCERGSMLKNV